MPDFLQIGLTEFTQYILYWGLLGVASAIGLHFTQLLPMSSRADNSVLAFLGLIDKRKGWIIMEVPILVVVLYCYFSSVKSIDVSVVFIAVFVMHYFHRALIFPYRIKVAGKTMPVSMMLSSMIFYIVNGYMIGYYFGALSEYPSSWLTDPRFIIGLSVFMFGFYLNISSDNILIRLRGPNETGYKIPYGGFYRYISCPNYFGEILEWLGFAIMTWCLPGVVYAAWVILPLIAQARGTHKWYLEHFKANYPQERKALIPFVL